MRLVLSLCLVGAAGSVWAQDAKTTLVLPPGPLLPDNIGTWVKEHQAFEGIWGDLPADRPESLVLGEAGQKHSEREVYYLPANPTMRITVTARQFGDATGAHAAYSYYLRPGVAYKGRRIGDETGDGYLFRSGTTVVYADSKASPASTGAMLAELETHLPKLGGPKGLPPLLPGLVPLKGLETGSVRYALGPVSYAAEGGVLPAEILDWEKSGEAVTARYGSTGGHSDGGAGEGVLTLLLYPTPQIAGERGRAIEASINANRAKYGTVKLRREGPLLLLATGGFSPAQEADLVGRIHLPVQLTWDKKMPLEFHAEVQKTYSLLTSITVFCGVGSLAAIILGLFLGVGRATIRVWMGKPAASEPEFLRIDLRGQSAPIHVDGPGAGTQG